MGELPNELLSSQFFQSGPNMCQEPSPQNNSYPGPPGIINSIPKRVLPQAPVLGHKVSIDKKRDKCGFFHVVTVIRHLQNASDYKTSIDS